MFRSDVHTHAARPINTADANARSVVNRMVESVTNGHESTRNVIRDAIHGGSERTLAAMPIAEERCLVEFSVLVAD